MAEYKSLEQMVEEVTTLSRRLSGTFGTTIAAGRGRTKSHTYAVTRRALDRLGLTTLEDFRPLQRKHLENLRETCQRVASSPSAPYTEKATAAVGFASANILLGGLDDIVDEAPHRKELEASR